MFSRLPVSVSDTIQRSLSVEHHRLLLATQSLIQYEAIVLFPPLCPPSLSVSLHCATFDLNYRLAAGLLAALPVCATE